MSNRDQEREKAHNETGRNAFDAIKEMVEALEQASKADDSDAMEAAQTAIQEDPLSVLVRDGWHEPGKPAEDGAEEYEILLSTGGPATRITGKLTEHGEPETAELQVQDWFVPWKEWRGDGWSETVLLTYAQQFYYGD